MRTTILLLLICTCCLSAAPAVWGQAANTPANRGILGFLDPHTGAFRPVPATAEDDAELPAATTFTGTITVTITITVKSASVSNFICSAGVSVLDGTTSPVFFDESDTVAATGSGSTRTCKLTIPYAWSLTTQSTDSMSTSYSISATTGTSGLPQRSASRSPLDTRKVPINGTTTALTAAVTI
jgi:hypothetical protein